METPKQPSKPSQPAQPDGTAQPEKYEAPAIESVLTQDQLGREVHYAGGTIV